MRHRVGCKFAACALLIGGSLSYRAIRVEDGYGLALQGDWPEQCTGTARLDWDDRHFHGWFVQLMSALWAILYCTRRHPIMRVASWLEDQQGVLQGRTIS